MKAETTRRRPHAVDLNLAVRTKARAARRFGGKRVVEPGNSTLIYVLMFPAMAMILNAATFGVAVPIIRNEFGIDADQAAWLVTAYMLPFMMFMPLYGRLGDALGKRNLILAGLGVFSIGTGLTMLSQGMTMLLVGRVIQGIGLAGINPLSMAILSERFPPKERGQALGTWNSIGPLVSMFGPLGAGFMIDHWGWRTIFAPMLFVGVGALAVVWWLIPSLRKVDLRFLRRFDWSGVALLFITVTAFIFYVSSRPITGVEPLRDWRLLALTIVAGTLFVFHERRREQPFLRLSLFANRSLRTASLSAAFRMFTMSGIGFLFPLYLVDVFRLSAAATGAMLMLNAGALLITMRKGGQLADRWGSRRPVMIGMSIQTLCMIVFALLPVSAGLGPLGLGLVVHGLGAGLSLAAMHRASMSHVRADENGAAAGVYSMIRFSGVLMGSALGGVLLQQALERMPDMVDAYHFVFWCVAAAALAGALVGSRIPE